MDQDPIAEVMWMVRGAWVTMTLRAGSRLGLFDLLGEPHAVATLAPATDTDPGALRRLLRALTELGLVTEQADDVFVVTDRGATLASDHPSHLRSLVLMQSWLPNVASWHHLDDAVRSGTGVYERVNGTSSWEHLAAHPDQEVEFNRAMARRADDQVAALLAGGGLEDAETVVDVGGGRGAMLAGLLRALPRLTGVVADRPEVAAEADAALEEAGLADRAHGVGADFFESVPSGADVYLISNVLHDWDDADCVRILRTVRAAMDDDARLVVVEKLLGIPGRTPLDARDLAFVDLHMLVMFGARERSREQYDALLTEAGFRPGEVPDTGTSWNLVTTRPAPA